MKLNAAKVVMNKVGEQPFVAGCGRQFLHFRVGVDLVAVVEIKGLGSCSQE